jgi:hypothetical protein
MLTEEQVRNRLKENEWADYVWNGGREYLLSSWEKVVKNVENGYDEDFMIEEYWNDLDTREAISLVEMDEEVKDLDQRFRNSIIHSDIRIRYGDDDYFWNFGYPKKAHGYFLKSLKEFIEDNR